MISLKYNNNNNNNNNNKITVKGQFLFMKVLKLVNTIKLSSILGSDFLGGEVTGYRGRWEERSEFFNCFRMIEAYLSKRS